MVLTISISSELLSGLFWVSLVIFLAGLAGLPLLILRMPADYFTRASVPTDSSSEIPQRRRLLVSLIRNVVALLFFAAGLIMLITPGQGLIAILAALWIAEFPGKRKLELKLIGLPGVAATINRLRVKAGREPLELPGLSRFRS